MLRNAPQPTAHAAAAFSFVPYATGAPGGPAHLRAPARHASLLAGAR